MTTYAKAKKMLETARKIELPKAIEKIHSLMAEFGITLADLQLPGVNAAPAKTASPVKKNKRKTKKASKPKANYKFMKDGVGFTGTGRRPAWVDAVIKAGGDLEEFRIGSKPKVVAKKSKPVKVAAKKKAVVKKIAKKKPIAKAASKKTAAVKVIPKKKPAVKKATGAKSVIKKAKPKAKAKAKPKAKTKPTVQSAKAAS